MQRKAVRFVGLVLAGAAAFAVLRRLLRRSGPGDDDGLGPPPEPPVLTPVPELQPESVAPEQEQEQEPEPVADVAPVAEPAAPSEPAATSGQSWVPPVDEDCPPGYPIKVNERSGIYHVPGGLSYERTRPTRCYADEAAAEADGFRRAKR